MLSISTTLKKYDSIAIGGFDGMHVGHQELFKALGDNGCVVVIDTNYASLTPKKDRKKFTKYPIVYLKLDDIRNQNAKEFIAFLKTKFIALKKIVIGYDFHFGKNRQYNIQNLKNLFNGKVVVIKEVKVANQSVHSHVIREKLSQGDIKIVSAFLGRNYQIRGKVVSGQGIGKKELVATINLDIKDYYLPKEGVYATLTCIDNQVYFYPSVTFIGHRISVDGSFAVETHILDKEVQCNKNATISFINFIRKNKKFNTLLELKNQIKKDIDSVKAELKVLKL